VEGQFRDIKYMSVSLNLLNHKREREEYPFYCRQVNDGGYRGPQMLIFSAIFIIKEQIIGEERSTQRRELLYKNCYRLKLLRRVD